MDKEKFEALTTDEQVQYFREQLAEGNNYNAICKKLGKSKNTVKPNFLKNGYRAILKGRTIVDFIKQEEDHKPTINNMLVTDIIATELPASPTRVDIKDIENRLTILEKKIEELNTNKKIDNRNWINDCSYNTVTKTFKIDYEVNQDLEEVLKEYRMYRKQDIISSLLRFAIENIK